MIINRAVHSSVRKANMKSNITSVIVQKDNGNKELVNKGVVIRFEHGNPKIESLQCQNLDLCRVTLLMMRQVKDLGLYEVLDNMIRR